MEHAERRYWCAQISRINRTMNENDQERGLKLEE
jgi:hypothetical protein